MPTRRNPHRNTGDRRPSGPLSEDELTGYRSGLEHRLAEGELPAAARREVRSLLDEAAAALGRHELRAAESALLQAEGRLDRLDDETELVEFPRGLVGYVPSGSVGAPPPRDEEPLANRMLLVERLWSVRRSDGHRVDHLLAPLHEAEAAYRAGDRARARRLVDRVHAALEDLDRSAPARGEA